MIIFKLRMVSDENEHFVRDYEVDAYMPLPELHKFIIESLDYDNCISSFFSSNDDWERLVEYTLVDMGAPETVPMDGVRICDLIQSEGDRVIFLFDIFENRGYYITLLDLEEVDKGDYPREGFAHGTPLDQYNVEAVNDDISIFDEMLDDFGDFGSEYEGDDEW